MRLARRREEVGMATRAQGPGRAPMSRVQMRVIFTSTLGSVFEWYDFYLYGALLAIIGEQFFAGLEPGSAFVFALLAFAAGFIVRPFGALLFGRLGDLVGRKYTFLVTLLVMGLSTFLVGVLPGYATIGVAAPVILVGLRMLQGLALGGEYGGAITYVAEHAPHGRRGFHTSFVQTSATLGLLLALLVPLATRRLLGEAAFADWGWRLPFLASIVLLVLGLAMRLSMNESPAFKRLRERGHTSRAPLTESFGRGRNMRLALLALFGLVAGQAVVWYTGQFYALFFLHNVLGLPETDATVMVAVALVLGTPMFVVWGALSDRIGRKPIILAGLALAALGTLPLFGALAQAVHPALVQAQQRVPIVLRADPATCTFQGSPIAREIDFTSPCDIARRTLARRAADHAMEPAAPGQDAQLHIGSVRLTPPAATLAPGGHRLDEASQRAVASFRQQVAQALLDAGYPGAPPPIEPLSAAWWKVVAILLLLVLLVTMVYGPIAAALVELFPTRIRYSSVSLPYHIGNGWFGGLMPTIAFALAAHDGQMLHGLHYTVVVAAFCCVIGLLFVRETKDIDIYARD
jgi:MFS family permease